LKVPVTVGVPLIVITSLDQLAVTPVGNPVAVPIPVALVVVWVMLVITVLTVTEGEEDADPAAQGRAGVTAFDAAEETELPTAFVATTVKVYGVPFVKPVTVIGELDPVRVIAPGFEVTV
jgi:hypothetical protein